MSNQPHRFRPAVESLGERAVPTALPFGGSVTVTTAVHGTQLTETVAYTSPAGQSVTETGTFTINPRTGAVSGAFAVVGPGGQTLATGTVTGTETAGELDGVVTVTGAGGRTFTHDFGIPVG